MHHARTALMTYLADIDQHPFLLIDHAHDTSTNDTLSVILEQLLSLMHAEGAALATADNQRGGMAIELAYGIWSELQGYWGKEDELFERDGITMPDYAACVPLISQGHTLGTLCVGRARCISGTDLEILLAMADIATRTLASRQRTRYEHQEMHDTALEGWVRALELRDNETEGHTRRVTEMTVHLARLLGMTEEEVIHIRRGALLHDIGKIAIPDSILLKAGPLTDEEWQTMRQHPLHACAMLCEIPFLQPALDIPRHHHEKWDGTGYPDGLQGTQIPLAARIFAVVDVWDALRSDRPYRKGWTEERVLEHIRSQAGIHFDPHVVQVFLNQSNITPPL
jgi:hypothetical protein